MQGRRQQSRQSCRGSRREHDSPSDPVRGSGVEYRALGAVTHHLGDSFQIELCVLEDGLGQAYSWNIGARGTSRLCSVTLLLN